MENKRKHLEMIQNVITRMAGNLFFLKGWVITLIAALFVLSAKDSDTKYIVIALFPAIIFWILDGFFLSQERLFRSLYDDVRMREEKDIDFSMDTRKFKAEKRNGWMASMFSPTLVWFYVSMIVLMIFVMFLIG